MRLTYLDLHPCFLNIFSITKILSDYEILDLMKKNMKNNNKIKSKIEIKKFINYFLKEF